MEQESLAVLFCCVFCGWWRGFAGVLSCSFRVCVTPRLSANLAFCFGEGWSDGTCVDIVQRLSCHLLRVTERCVAQCDVRL